MLILNLKKLLKIYLTETITIIYEKCFIFQKGCTPLHIACSLGSKGILDLLLQHGAIINKQNKVCFCTGI